MTLTVSGGVFDHAAIDKKIKDTEALTAAPDFWNDTENAQRPTERSLVGHEAADEEEQRHAKQHQQGESSRCLG